MPFPKDVRETALVKSRRRCCVCHEFAGRAINVHHILQEADGGPNTLDNAIVLCLRCHSEAGHFNPRHAIGTKYSPSELRRHRDEWWKLCDAQPSLSKSSHIEVSWTRTTTTQDFHIYRAQVVVHNSFESTVNNWKLKIYFPMQIPVEVQGIERLGTEVINRIAYTSYEITGIGPIYPGENVELIGHGLVYAQYEMNDDLYDDSKSNKWKFIWQFYCDAGPSIKGEAPWIEMHEF